VGRPRALPGRAGALIIVRAIIYGDFVIRVDVFFFLNPRAQEGFGAGTIRTVAVSGGDGDGKAEWPRWRS
jgi:hypothetical protein